MGRFDISPEVAEEYRTKFREAVMPHVDEEILAVGTFRTTGSGTKFAISKLQAGAAVYGAVSKLGRARAGGLPNTFLLAVTPTKLQAFKYKLKGQRRRREAGGRGVGPRRPHGEDRPAADDDARQRSSGLKAATSSSATRTAWATTRGRTTSSVCSSRGRR